MANNELAIRFTENSYATKSEVSKELKMSLIDNIWNNILSYRSNFYRYLALKSIENNQLLLCNCPNITSRINSVDSKLIRLMAESLRMGSPVFEEQCKLKTLKLIAKKNQIDVTDDYLIGIINGKFAEISPSHKALQNYFNAEKIIERKYIGTINIDLLAEIYSKVTGNENLTSFYRSEEDNNPENRILIDRIYTCAPINSIEHMMNQLFSFLQVSSLSAVTKAIITYYYVNYIRPFPDYSDEIALLLAKTALASNGLCEFGTFIPLEELLVENPEINSRVMVEVQKTNDVTYFVNYCLKIIDARCDELLDSIAEIKAGRLKKDLYRPDEEKPVVVEETPKVEQTIEETPAVENKNEIQENKEVKPIKVSIDSLSIKEEIAVDHIPAALDEKSAYRLEQHLLELEPTMKKGEARFYSRHCSLGKSYTIAQYKKCIGCVYETARTSMEHLVTLGYYGKQLVNNKKFVYTPIKKN